MCEAIGKRADVNAAGSTRNSAMQAKHPHLPKLSGPGTGTPSSLHAKNDNDMHAKALCDEQPGIAARQRILTSRMHSNVHQVAQENLVALFDEAGQIILHPPQVDHLLFTQLVFATFA